MLKAGEATIAVEEAEPSLSNLHESEETNVVIKNALPGMERPTSTLC